MSQRTNTNMRIVRRAAERLGAKVIELRIGQKHDRVFILTSEGKKKTLVLSHSPQCDYKLSGWVRQIITRPERPR